MFDTFNKFDIVINAGKQTRTNWFKKLYEAVRPKISKPRTSTVAKNLLKMYNTLQEEQQFKYALRVKDADLNFEVVSSTTKNYYVEENKFDLMSDFERLVKLVTELFEEPKREEVIEIRVELPRPKPKKLVKITSYEKVTIFERWVKIGYKMYQRQFDLYTGEEYITVDGDVFLIKRDRNGKEYLA